MMLAYDLVSKEAQGLWHTKIDIVHLLLMENTLTSVEKDYISRLNKLNLCFEQIIFSRNIRIFCIRIENPTDNIAQIGLAKLTLLL
jgi:hypothetical protein